MLPIASSLYLTITRVLAQTPQGGGAPAPMGGAGDGTGAPGGAAQGSPSSFLPMLLFGFLIFMVITMVMSGRREKKARAELMSSLAKHDKVQTAGGMIGTIVEIKGEEVVLKVDESTNTKVRFSRNSVTTILKKGRGGSETLPEPETVDSDS